MALWLLLANVEVFLFGPTFRVVVLSMNQIFNLSAEDKTSYEENARNWFEHNRHDFVSTSPGIIQKLLY